MRLTAAGLLLVAAAAMADRAHACATCGCSLSTDAAMGYSADRAHACATCGCSLSTDAAMGYSAVPGWQLSLQYDFIDQKQLRFGRHAIGAAGVAALNDAGGEQEVERQTISRTTTLGIGYAPNADWNLRLLVPYLDRGHSTYGVATNPLTPEQVSGSTLRGLGDVRLIGSYQGRLDDKSLGFQLGIKASTGRYGGPTPTAPASSGATRARSARDRSRRTRRPATLSTPACSPAPVARRHRWRLLSPLRHRQRQCLGERAVPGRLGAPPGPARPGLSPRQHDDDQHRRATRRVQTSSRSCR